MCVRLKTAENNWIWYPIIRRRIAIHYATTPKGTSRNISNWLNCIRLSSLPERLCWSCQLYVNKQKYRSAYRQCVFNTRNSVYSWNWNMQHNMRVQYLYCCCKRTPPQTFVSLTGGTSNPSIHHPILLLRYYCKMSHMESSSKLI
jgi:hypothetical protein